MAFLGLLIATGPDYHAMAMGFEMRLGPVDYAMAQPEILLAYLRRVLWPHPLVVDYGQVEPVPWPRLLVSATAMKGLAERLKLTPGQSTYINFWFRHIWELAVPVYPSVIAASVVLAVPLSTIVVTMLPARERGPRHTRAPRRGRKRAPRQTVNELPQPHPPVELGLLNANPAPSRVLT